MLQEAIHFGRLRSRIVALVKDEPLPPNLKERGDVLDPRARTSGNARYGKLFAVACVSDAEEFLAFGGFQTDDY